MIPEGQSNETRPGVPPGRVLLGLRITSPDGTVRDVEVEASITDAQLSLDPPDSPKEV